MSARSRPFPEYMSKSGSSELLGFKADYLWNSAQFTYIRRRKSSFENSYSENWLYRIKELIGTGLREDFQSS